MALTAVIDLTTAAVEVSETSETLLKKYLGGRGLGAKILYDYVGPDVDPLSPDNYLIFSAGPFAGTPWPTSSRLHVTFKSPLTNAYGYANSGGFFAAELRQAGYDAVVITGKAKNPSILRIIDDQVTIEEAADLWGRTTGKVHDALLGADARPSAGRVACIGPAGEKLVRIAAIINEYNRAAARSGPGAVMGSKNLKAVHVKANGRPDLPPEFRETAKKAARHIKDDPKLNFVRTEGTMYLMDPKNASGDQPARNHQLVQVPFINQINTAAFDKYLLEHKGCYSCSIKCGRKSRVESGPYAIEIGGPEYETTNALGPMCWIGDPEVIIYGNHLCNKYGLDTISTGVVIAFAMELHERGLLNDDELSLEWGDADSMLGLIERIAYRKGIGDMLAEGVMRSAEIVGGEAAYYALHVKGMELPRQEPRFCKGFGLGHSTSNRGADHLYSMEAIDLAGDIATARRLFPEELLKEVMDPGNEKYKPDLVVYGENNCAVSDSLGICKFSTVQDYSLYIDDLAPGVAALWQQVVGGEDLLEIGERIVNLERMYNVREGMRRADDRLPRRFLEEPAPLYEFIPDPQTGEMQRSEEPIRFGIIEGFDAMLDRYYDLRDWDRDGVPRADKLEQLDLNELF